MAVKLTSGAISKIMSGKCTENDIKPVLQLIYIDTGQTHTTYNKKWYGVVLSDGCFSWACFIPVEFFILSNKLQKGSIIRLTMFQLTRLLNAKDEIVPIRGILALDLAIIHSNCHIIGDPKLLPEIETPLVEKNAPTIPDEEEHVEEPPTSKQNPTTSTQKFSSHFPTSEQKHDRVDPDLLENIDESRHLEEPPTSKQNQDHADSPINENIKDVDEPPTFIQNPSTSTQKCSSHSPTLKQKQDRVDPDINENIDDCRHVEEPPTSTQECSFHSLTQTKKNTIIGVDLTPGATTKIMADKCISTDLKPVVQVTNILSGRISTKNDKQCYRKVVLSDGSSSHFGCIADDIFISNKLQKGSILQLTKFHFTKYYGNIRYIRVCDFKLLSSKCGIIGAPKRYCLNETPLVVRTTTTIPDKDHANSHHVEESLTSKQKQVHVIDIDDVEEPPTFISNPSTSTQKQVHVIDIDDVEEPPTFIPNPSTSTQKQVHVIDIDDVEEPPTFIPNLSTSTQKCSSHFPTSKQKQDRVDPYLLQNIDDSRHVEEPPTSKPNPSTSTKRCSSHVDPDVNDETHHADEPAAPKQKCSSCSQTQSRKRQRQSSDNKEDGEIGACFEKLEKLGWGKGPMYDTAVQLFNESSDFRRIWMDYCVEWTR